MGASFAVSNRFTAKDGVSKAFGRMGKGADKFGKRSSRAFRDASRSASRFQDVTKGILAAGAIRRTLSGLAQGVRSVSQQFIDFDDAIVGATVRFKDIGPDAADFNKQLRKLKNTARDAGATTEFTAAQAAKGLDFLARAGFNSVEAIGSLKSMIDLATASGEDFASVADMSSDLLGAFGLAVEDSGQKIKNLNRLNDVLVKSANSANVTIETMFETMKEAAPIGNKLGISLEEVAAATAFLGGVGIKGSKAATALKNSFLNLAALPKKTADALKDIGVSVDDGTGNMRKFSTILKDVGTKLKGVGTLKTAKVLDAIFGKRAIAGAANLMDGVEAVESFEKSLLDAGGVAKRTADILRQSLGNKLKSLGSAATEFGFKFLEAFEIKGKKGIDVLTEAIRNFDPTPIISGLKMAMQFAKGLFNVIQPFIPIMPVLIGGLLTYGAVLKGIAIFKTIQGFLMFAKALKIAAASQGILNAVMMANPLGAIIFAITAVVALVVLLEKKFGILTKLWEGIQSVGKAVGSFFIPEQNEAFNKRVAAQKNEAFNKKIEGQRTAPNSEEVAARQQGSFSGRLDIAGAPEGSTVSSASSGALDIELEMMGLN